MQGPKTRVHELINDDGFQVCKQLLKGEQMKVKKLELIKSKHQPSQDLDYCLKEHGNEADFLGFLNKFVLGHYQI
jgi:hypothetical protein